MADKGYGPTFKLMLRYGGGLRVITNELSIRIVELLLTRDMNMTEISRSARSPKTTVQANLGRLEEDGLITSYPDGEDNRSLIYSICCSPIYTSYRFGNNGTREQTLSLAYASEGGKDTHEESMMIYSSKMRSMMSASSPC